MRNVTEQHGGEKMKISQTILLVVVVMAVIAATLATTQGEEAGEACENPDIFAVEQSQLSETGSSETLYGVLRESGSGGICQSENSLFEKQAGNPTTSLYKGDSYNSR